MLPQAAIGTARPSPTAADRRSRPHRRARRWRRRDTLIGYCFISPGIVGLLLLVVYPMVTSLYHSFTNWNGLTPAKWVGLANYKFMFTQDPKFWPSLRVTVLWVVVSVPVTMAAGLALAVLVDRQLPAVRLFRTIFYLPVVLPAVAVLTLWKYIYDPTYGLANEVLRFFHLPTSLWLGDAHVALAAILLVGVWGVGGTMMIFLAGLQAVPREIYEAARVDGAGPIRQFIRITLPMLGPILILQLMLQLNMAFQTFNQVAILTKGGPGTSTNLLMYKIYNDGFANYITSPQLGYATAEVWVLFVVVMIVTIPLLLLTRNRMYQGAE